MKKIDVKMSAPAKEATPAKKAVFKKKVASAKSLEGTWKASSKSSGKKAEGVKISLQETVSFLPPTDKSPRPKKNL